MSMLDTLATIARGMPHANVLNTCRLEVGGHHACGVEAIGEAFRRDPLAIEPANKIENAHHFAFIDDGQALFADLYDGNIGRLWRAGRPSPGALEPHVAVPFDPDLAQARGDVAFLASDHPLLAEAAHDRVRAAGLAVLAADTAAWRSRAFCIRAFGDAPSGAALFAVYRMSGDAVRSAGFGHAIAIWHDEAVTFAADDVVATATAGRINIAS